MNVIEAEGSLFPQDPPDPQFVLMPFDYRVSRFCLGRGKTINQAPTLFSGSRILGVPLPG